MVRKLRKFRDMCVFPKDKLTQKTTKGGQRKAKPFVCFIILLIQAIFYIGCGSEMSYNEEIDSAYTNESDDEASLTTFQMDTIVTQQWYGENAEKTCEEIEAALTDLENRISLYIDDSEISQINDMAGKEYVQVSDDVFELLSEAKELCEESGGIFDITIAPLVLLWDITGDNPHVPEQSEIDEALTKVDYNKLLINEEDNSVMLEDEGMQLDLGGIAKGYAASLMREIAEENNVTGYLSIGGNMLVMGGKPDGSDFVIGIRDPLQDANSYFATINIEGYTMATSSAVERYFEEDGVIYHHILSPETGYPGETDLLQVTVVSENGLLADALSTTIFLKGSECLDEYLSRDDCMVLAVTEECEVYGSEGIWELLTPTNTDTYTFIEE